MTSIDIKSELKNLEYLLRNEYKFFEVEQKLQNIIDSLDEDLSPELHTNIYLLLSETFWRRGIVDKAFTAAEHTMQYVDKLVDMTLKGRVFNNIGLLHKDLMEFDKACSYFYKAIDHFKQTADLRGEAVSHNSLGMTLVELNKYSDALQHYTISLDIFDNISNLAGKASVYGNIGNIYHLISDYVHAIEHYKKSILIFESTHNLQGIAVSFNNIGNIYFDFKFFESSQEYYEKAIGIYKQLGDLSGLADCYVSVGNIYSNLHNYPTSIQWISDAIDLYRKIDNKSKIAHCLGILGYTNTQLKEFTAAHSNFNEALSIYNELDNHHKPARIYARLADLYCKENSIYFNLNEAIRLYQKALKICEILLWKSEEKDIHTALSHIYSSIGKYKKAYYHMQKYTTLDKEIFTDQANKTAIQFELERTRIDQENQAAIERLKHDTTRNLLYKTLPISIADRLLLGETEIVDRFDNVSILFADLVGFTPFSTKVIPKDLIDLLNSLFSSLDKLADIHKVERIKTIGDAYMAVSGAPIPSESHAQRIGNFALDVLKEFKHSPIYILHGLDIRIGISSGESIAAIIGKNKFSYDLWGDAVNIASRMEMHGKDGKIHISEQFANEIKNYPEFRIVPRGQIEIKGKGMMKTYFLERNKDL
ncbi:MAG: adenylate/guanylate cyclase domain-containing protein [Ignavibacteria bacterium]